MKTSPLYVICAFNVFMLISKSVNVTQTLKIIHYSHNNWIYIKEKMNSKKDDVITFKYCQKWLLIKNIFESEEDINKVDFDYQNV